MFRLEKVCLLTLSAEFRLLARVNASIASSLTKDVQVKQHVCICTMACVYTHTLKSPIRNFQKIYLESGGRIKKGDSFVNFFTILFL